MTEAPGFKLTINLPAQHRFFDGDDVVGMQIRINQDTVFFRPVSSLEEIDTVGFTTRPRGGFEAHIEGSMSAKLLDILMHQGSAQRPFFILHRGDGGWLGIENFTEAGAPPKFTPHLRIWPPRSKTMFSRPSPLDDAIANTLGDFVHQIRAAHHIVTEYEQTYSAGRPPFKVAEARYMLNAFKVLAAEVLPAVNIADLIGPLRSNLIGMIDHFISTVTASAEPGRAALARPVGLPSETVADVRVDRDDHAVAGTPVVNEVATPVTEAPIVPEPVVPESVVPEPVVAEPVLADAASEPFVMRVVKRGRPPKVRPAVVADKPARSDGDSSQTAMASTLPRPVRTSQPVVTSPVFAQPSLPDSDAEPDFIEVYPDPDDDTEIIEHTRVAKVRRMATDFVENYPDGDETGVDMFEETMVVDDGDAMVLDDRGDGDATEDDRAGDHGRLRRRAMIKEPRWRNTKPTGGGVLRRR